MEDGERHALQVGTAGEVEDSTRLHDRCGVNSANREIKVTNLWEKLVVMITIMMMIIIIKWYATESKPKPAG